MWAQSRVQVITTHLGKSCLPLLRLPSRFGGAAVGLLAAMYPGGQPEGSTSGTQRSHAGLAGGSTLAWQCPDPVSNIEASAAIMLGYSSRCTRCSAWSSGAVPEQPDPEI
jgi:hypothetical protein